MSENATWGGLSLELPPPVLEPVITAINTFLELIIVVLDITLVVLDIVKVFIVGLLSPLLAVIDAIIELFESLANDLRKAGFYARFDKFTAEGKSFEEHMAEKQGGFEAFESRCFNWLIDSSDPKRPDFSTASGVLGLVFYGSVDFEEFMKLIRMIQSIARLFGASELTPLAQPTNLKCEMKVLGGVFGVSKIGFTDMLDGDVMPGIAGLSWGHAASPASPLGISLPPRPPSVSIIELSTTPEGLFVGATRSAPGPTDPERLRSEFVEAPLALGGGPLKIYGGTQTLVGADGNFHSGGSVLAPGKKGGIWFVKDKNDVEPIYLKEWVAAEKEKGGAIGQCQIVVNHGSFLNAVFPNFEYDLEYESCPYAIKRVVKGKPEPEAERSREVFVRISSGNKPNSYVPPNKKLTASDSDAMCGFTIDNVTSPKDPLKAAKFFPSNAKRSKPSQMLKVRFPSDSQKVFTQMIRNAAIIAYLCRGSVDDNINDPAKKPSKPSGFAILAKKMAVYVDRGEKVYEFDGRRGSRKKIAAAARRLADDFTNIAGFIPDSVFESLVEAHAHNLNFKMGKQLSTSDPSNKSGSPVDSFGSRIGDGFLSCRMTAQDEADFDLYTHCAKSDGKLGVHLNYPSLGDDPALVAKCTESLSMIREVRSDAGSRYTKGQVTAHMSALPIVVGVDDVSVTDSDWQSWDEEEWAKNIEVSSMDVANVEYARELFTLPQLKSAQAILNIATNLSGDAKGWVAFRPFDAGWLEPVEDFIEAAVKWLKIVREGILAVIKQILDYIRMIEARIVELQQLIRKIQAILAMFADFVVSADLHMLVVSGAGTQGLISEFMTAEEKPSDGPDAYGMGGIVVAGGLPLIILDIIKTAFALSPDKPSGGAAGAGGGGASATDLLEDTGA